MESIIGSIVLLVVGASAFINYESLTNNVTYVKSNVDGNKYLVQNLENKHEAADLLATVRQKLVKFVNKLAIKFPNRADVQRLKRNFNPNVIVEKPDNGNYTSYTINKGQKIVICLRPKNSKQELIEENVVMFVALHEISHCMCESVGHKPEFWEDFKFILKEAIEDGTYKYVNFNSNPHQYCGIKITDSPYHP